MALTLRCDGHGAPVEVVDTNLLLTGDEVTVVCNTCLAGAFTLEHHRRANTR